MALGKRQWILGFGLASTVIAAILAPEPEAANVVQPLHAGSNTAVTKPDVATALASADFHVMALLPRHGGRAATLFITPPRPRPVFVPALAVLPAAPVEPPLPAYNVIGRYDNGGGSQMLLLATGKDTVEAQVGDTVGNGWQIKSISDDGIVFVSPAGHEQLLPTGDGQ